jgi:hypothetical protein
MQMAFRNEHFPNAESQIVKSCEFDSNATAGAPPKPTKPSLLITTIDREMHNPMGIK